MKGYKWLQASFLYFILLLAVIAVLLSGPGSFIVSSVESRSYIVQGTDVDRVVNLVQARGGEVTSRLDVIGGVAALLPENAVVELIAEAEITAVMPNAPVRTAADVFSPEQPTSDFSEVVGANHVWAEGITGEGVTVAIVDSGLSSTLPGLAQDTKNTARVVAWRDFVGNLPAAVPSDPNGHGSHVAGVVANSRKGADNAWNGVAPDVRLVSVRVLNEEGMGNYEQVIQGIQWVIDNKDAYNIKVMNLSLVAAPQSPYWADPLNQAVMHAWASGITVVAAAGNGGPDPMTISVPGNIPYVITVGAFTDSFTPDDWSDDYITPFSAAGPTLDGLVKPDVVAPGAHIVSKMRADAHLAQAHPDNRVGGTYFSMAGTSQATAVVSGIAALVLDHNPDLTPDQVKYRLMHTALLWSDLDSQEALYSMWQQGAGRVNAPDAVFADTDEAANYGLDIEADLADPESGYEGYSYYDETTGQFRLHDDPGTWPSGYGNWSGHYDTWTGGYTLWAGDYAAWAGGYTLWAGGYTLWAGGFSTWAGGYTLWAGGYTLWAGGYTLWAGNEPWASRFDDPVFVASYIAGESPDPKNTPSSINEWIEERDWSQKHIYLPTVLR